MDPLTAIGLASNILSFIEFSVTVVSGAVDIYGSPFGLTEENRSSEVIVAEMRHFASKLQSPDDAQLTGDEKAICRLAHECDELSKQIIALIERVRPKDRKSKSASILAGLRSKWHEAERRKVEDRLEHCRAQLALQLHYLTSSEVKGKLDTLVMSAKDDSSRLEQLSSQVNSLNRDVTISSLSPTAQAQLESLLGVSEHAVNLIAQQRILNSLAFKGMYGRYDAVDDAHYKTFRWIFGRELNSDLDGDSQSVVSTGNATPEESWVSRGDQFDDRSEDSVNGTANSEFSIVPNNADSFGSGSIGQDQEPKQTAPRAISDVAPEEDKDTEQAPASVGDPEKAAAKKILLDWLSFGNGIFHISGKLGSGKSTLMKYLCEHKSTRVMLKRWAAGRNLVFANFFFWKPGTSLQKSLTGLLRSLLHDTLQTSRELIPYILPDQWAKVKLNPSHAMNEIRYSDKEIRNALLRLMSNAKFYKEHCFCFFIDGLDEYEGTLQNDTKSLVDQLCSWTAMAPDNVKLCVSSREYNVFMNKFPESKRIRLHQLTRSDMEHYAADKLSHMDVDEDKAELTRAIVDNAHGIFLWVSLVTKKIREQIENGSSTAELKREIETLPEELDDLFAHLLSSLSKFDRKRAYQTLAMVLEISKWPQSSLSLLAYSFLDDYNRSPSFALHEDFGTAQLKPDNCAPRNNMASKKLNGCCKGLVEVVSKEKQNPDTYIQVIEFTHRSVPEFLSAKAQRDNIICLLEGFNTVDALSQLTLATLVVDPHIVYCRSMENILEMLVLFRTGCKLDNSPYLFLESLSEAIAQARLLIGSYSLEQSGRFALIPEPDGRLVIVGTGVAGRFKFAAVDQPKNPIYPAAFFGNWEYVRWRLRQNFIADTQISLQVLLICILRSESPASNMEEALETVDVLISRGLTPQAVTDISYLDVYAFERHDPKTQLSVNMTIWQHLLLTCCGFTVWNSREYLQLGYVLEKYLEHGADPYFLFCATQEQKEEKREWVLRLVLGREQRELLLRYDGHFWMPYPCEASSLTEFIELFHFENKDRILRLIERNTEILEGKVESGREEDGGENLDMDQLHEDGVLEVATPRKATHINSFSTIALFPLGAFAFVAVVVQLMRIMAR